MNKPNKKTIKQIVSLLSDPSRQYRMEWEEAIRLSNSRSAPAWASRYAGMVVAKYEEDHDNDSAQYPD